MEPLQYTYNVQEVNVIFDAGSKLTLRGGHRYVWGDAVTRAPAGGFFVSRLTRSRPASAASMSGTVRIESRARAASRMRRASPT